MQVRLRIVLAVAVLLTGAAAAADDTRPPEPLASAARNYRIRVYFTFRQQRSEFDRRYQAGFRVLADWRAAGRRSHHTQEAAAWFRAARLRSTPGSLGPLPPSPRFGPLTVEIAPPRPLPSPPLAPPTVKPAMTPARPAPPVVPPPAPAPVVVAPVAPPAVRPEVVLAPAVAHPLPASAGPVADEPPRLAPRARQPRSIADAPPVFDVPPPVDAAEVNVVELAARIDGHNRALETLEGGLLLEENWSPRALAAALAELENLALHRRDAILYVRLLERDIRELVPPLRPHDLARDTFRRRIAESRATAASGSSSDILDALDRKLTELAAVAAPPVD